MRLPRSSAGSRRGPRFPLWASAVLNLVVALVIVSLVQAFLVKVYRVPSDSMELTLQGNVGGGDRVLVDRTAYLGGRAPQPGDVVVFSRPHGWAPEAASKGRGTGAKSVVRFFGDLTGIGPSNEDYLVKRVVAHGGQTVECCDASGQLLRDGQSVQESYLFEDLPFTQGRLDCRSVPRSMRCFGPFHVPEGELVVLGDHRSVSADSVITCRGAESHKPCVRTIPVGAVVGRVFGRIWPLERFEGL